MLENKIIRKLVDVETGELIIELHEGDNLKITSEEQRKAIQKSFEIKELNEEIRDWNNELGGFVFVLFKYCDLILNQYSEITPEDITKLFYLATYVDYNGYLIFNEKQMKRKDLMLKLDVSRIQFDLFFNKMLKLGILIYKDKLIKVNKNYFSKGEIDKEIKAHYNYTRLYIKTIRYLYDNVSKRNKGQLGIYFKLIPYIHRQQNVLCWNPDSNKKEEIDLIKLKDVKEIVGYHKNSVKPFIDKLLKTRLENGEAILGFFVTKSDFWESTVIINPRVFYGGNFDIKNGRYEIVKWFKTQ